MEPKLKIRITTPRETLFEGEASSVSSTNVDGAFDILPMHANFITFIQGKKIIVRLASPKQGEGGTLQGEQKEFELDFAIVYNRENTVNIYTDIQLPNLEELAD